MFGGLLSAITEAVPFVAPFFGGKKDDSMRRYQMQYDQSIDFWNRQNAYNHPAEQMRRFREAGLNPHLIYGQTNTAGPIATAPVPESNGEKPDYFEGLFKYQSLKNGEAQHQLIEAQKDFALEQASNSAFNRELAAKNYALSAANQEMNRGLIASQILLNNAKARNESLKYADNDNGLLESIGKPLALAAGGLAGSLGFKTIYDIVKGRFFSGAVSGTGKGEKSAAGLASNVVRKSSGPISNFLGKAGRLIGRYFTKKWWPSILISMFVF